MFDLTVSEQWHLDCEAELREALAASTGKVLVVDDDPTGTQPVHGVPVVTSWTVDDLVWALTRPGRLAFASTNSRSMSAGQAAAVVREVTENAHTAATRLGVGLTVVSRGDSTLRGHLHEEVRAIVDAAARHGVATSGVLVVPAYIEAGRVTVDGEHCLLDGGTLTPLSATDYARDATFGYRSSRLPEFVAEKTGVPAGDVGRIGLEQLRAPTVEPVLDVLRGTAPGPDGRPPFVAVDAADHADLFRLATALLRLEREGRRFVCRTGPSFVRALGGVLDSPLLTDASIAATTATHGGLVVVGSHVGLTSRQLDHLQRTSPRTQVELNVRRLFDGGEEYVDETADRVAAALRSGHLVLATSRTLLRGEDADDSLRIAEVIARSLVAVLRRVMDRVEPAYLVAKGGVTSSTVFSDALGASRADVLGSALPGIVSVWRPVDGRRPGVPYVVFAGNVGDETSLAAVVARLEGG